MTIMHARAEWNQSRAGRNCGKAGKWSSGAWGSDAVLRILSTGGELLLPDQFPALAFVHPVLLALSRIEKRKDQARFGRAFGAEYLPLLAPFVARGPVFIDATH
jgi:hypothetical protein